VIVHWLYTAIVRPILLYGNIVWWSSLENIATSGRIRRNKIQRSAELCIRGALRATEALNTIIDLQPLDLLAKSWAPATALRLRGAAAWTTGSTGHSNILSKHTSLPRSTDYVPPIVNFERRYKIFIPTRTDWDNLPHQFENAVNIYTDGSKLNSQTGGVVFSPELVSFRLPDHCSVFEAEVMAIQEAMTHLDTSVHHDIDIFIFSDSQAALSPLNSYTTNSKTISECRKSFNEMATHLRINLIWVTGHRNIEGNCIADELARQETTADNLRDKDTVGMPMPTCKLHLRQRLYTLSNKRWNSISTCHNSRLTWPNYNSKRTKSLSVISPHGHIPSPSHIRVPMDRRGPRNTIPQFKVVRRKLCHCS